MANEGSVECTTNGVDEVVEKDDFVVVEPDKVSLDARRLHDACPTAALDECQRFADAFGRTAHDHLESFLTWKKSHGLDAANSTGSATTPEDGPPLPQRSDGVDSNDADAALWTYAKQKAHRFHHAQAYVNAETTSDFILNEPILMAPSLSAEATAPMTTRPGHTVVYVIPARMNPVALAERDTYTTALALYLYHSLLWMQKPHVSLLVDVRAGRGWSNEPVTKMYGFIRHVIPILRRFFPGRVHSVTVLPIPTLACWAYHTVVAPFLDADLKQCLTLVAGPSTSYSAEWPSHEALDALLTTEQWQRLESLRHAAFD